MISVGFLQTKLIVNSLSNNFAVRVPLPTLLALYEIDSPKWINVLSISPFVADKFNKI